MKAEHKCWGLVVHMSDRCTSRILVTSADESGLEEDIRPQQEAQQCPHPKAEGG